MWKIMALTATSMLLVLLLVILSRKFQMKFKAHFPPRSVPQPWVTLGTLSHPKPQRVDIQP